MANRPEPIAGVDELRENYQTFMMLSSEMTHRRLTKGERERYALLKRFFDRFTQRRDSEAKKLKPVVKAFATLKVY
jgi:hypothetical protein